MALGRAGRACEPARARQPPRSRAGNESRERMRTPWSPAGSAGLPRSAKRWQHALAEEAHRLGLAAVGEQADEVGDALRDLLPERVDAALRGADGGDRVDVAEEREPLARVVERRLERRLGRRDDHEILE